jgi:hypothetical protein
MTLPLFQFLILYTLGTSSWTGVSVHTRYEFLDWDQPVAMPLPAHRTTETQNKHTDIHVLSGIRTHDPTVLAGEECSRFRRRGHRDQHLLTTYRA